VRRGSGEGVGLRVFEELRRRGLRAWVFEGLGRRLLRSWVFEGLGQGTGIFRICGITGISWGRGSWGPQSGQSCKSRESRSCSLRLLAPTLLLFLLLLAPLPAFAAETAEETLERFAATSLLAENAFTVAHGVNTDPESTREWNQLRRVRFSFYATDILEFSAGVGIWNYKFETFTTLRNEVLWEDMTLGANVSLPAPPLPEGVDWPFYAAIGGIATLPTSKISQAESLILSPAIWSDLAVIVPVLDGWYWGYRYTVAPRIHEFTTWSTRTPRPCSPATGCTFGATTDTGWLNTKAHISHGGYTSLNLLGSMLSVTASLDVTYGVLHDKSPSTTYGEDVLSDPANPNGGSPNTLSSAFLFDVTFAPHDSFAVSVGLWTPGGMRPDGGWYNPVGNRFSQFYVDFTFYPFAFGLGVAKAVQNAGKANSDAAAKARAGNRRRLR